MICYMQVFQWIKWRGKRPCWEAHGVPGVWKIAYMTIHFVFQIGFENWKKFLVCIWTPNICCCINVRTNEEGKWSCNLFWCHSLSLTMLRREMRCMVTFSVRFAIWLEVNLLWYSSYQFMMSLVQSSINSLNGCLPCFVLNSLWSLS